MGKLFSTTWSYFTKVDEKLAECKLCRKMVKTSGNTTNAKNHLKVKHKLTDDEIGPTPSKKGHPEGSRYSKTEQKEVEILQEIPTTQKDEPMDEHYELQQSEPEDKEEIYCLEMLEEEDEEISQDSPQFESKQPTIVLKRSSEEPKRPRRLSSPQHSSDSAPSAPRYDSSSAVDTFFASMAATVKQMPPEKVVLIKQKIANIVFQEELQQLRSEGYQYVQE